MKKPLLSVVLLAAVGLPGFAQQPSPPMSSPTDAAHAKEHSAGVESRGDQGMGFRHDLTSHHFRLFKNGGAIEIQADDPQDTASKEAILQHLARIAGMFSEGDFSLPLFIHDTTPPGVDTMKRLKGEITYQAQGTARGAQVLISTDDPVALGAVHDFLRFQITDHRTGDSLEIQRQGSSRPRPGDNLGRDARPAID